MIVLPDTTTYDSSMRLVQLVGSTTKVNMLKVCDKQLCCSQDAQDPIQAPKTILGGNLL